jgi:hypothetical protein
VRGAGARSLGSSMTPRNRRIGWALLALLIAAVSVIGVGMTATAATWTPVPVEKVTDPATSHEFPGHQDSDHYSASRNPGRIWTDKTVHIGDTQSDSGEVADDNELTVSLSGLGSTRRTACEDPGPTSTFVSVSQDDPSRCCSSLIVGHPGERCGVWRLRAPFSLGVLRPPAHRHSGARRGCWSSWGVDAVRHQ